MACPWEFYAETCAWPPGFLQQNTKTSASSDSIFRFLKRGSATRGSAFLVFLEPPLLFADLLCQPGIEIEALAATNLSKYRLP